MLLVGVDWVRWRRLQRGATGTGWVLGELSAQLAEGWDEGESGSRAREGMGEAELLGKRRGGQHE